MNNKLHLYHKLFAFHCTLTILHFSRMRRNVTRIVYDARKNVSATTTCRCRYMLALGLLLHYNWHFQNIFQTSPFSSYWLTVKHKRKVDRLRVVAGKGVNEGAFTAKWIFDTGMCRQEALQAFDLIVGLGNDQVIDDDAFFKAFDVLCSWTFCSACPSVVPRWHVLFDTV